MKTPARLAPWLQQVGQAWRLVWIIRVPLVTSLLLTGLFIGEAQCRDSLRFVLEYVNVAGLARSALRLVLLLVAAALGAVALWFWARQSLRALAEPADRERRAARVMPRLLAVMPLLALAVAVGRMPFDDPGMQVKRWGLAAAFVAVAVTVYVALHLRQRLETLAWARTNRAYQWMAWTGAGLALAVFLFSLLIREYAVLFSPVGVLWLGAAFWVTVLSPVAIHGMRHGMPWLLLLAGFGAVLGLRNCSDNHGIRHQRAGAAEPDPVVTTSVVDGFRAWLRTQPDDGPVIFVAAEGGGVYAAYHSAMLMARLQERTQGEFGQRVFMISAVSGGSVGSGVFVSLMAAEQTNAGTGRRVDYVRASRQVLESDLLSPLLLAAAGPDAIQQFLPVGLPLLDRARALEDTLAHRWRAAEAEWLGGDARGRIDWGPDGDFWSLWLTPDRRGIRTDLPALFINTTVVETGSGALLAPYGVPHVGQAAAHRPPALFHLWAGAPGLKIPIPTALALSARFPYVTPPGGLTDLQLRPVDLPFNQTMRKNWRFADGGYYDNTGIETVLAVLQVLAGEREAGRPLLPMERVRVLVIRARNESGWPNDEGLADLLTPVRTLLRVRGNRGDLAWINLLARLPGDQYADSTLHTSSSSRLDRGRLPGRRPKPDIPLGWMLSQNSAERINDHIDTQLPGIVERLMQRPGRVAPAPPDVRLSPE